MFSRREALRRLGVTGGALALAGFAKPLRAAKAGPQKAPARFVFIIRSNGVLATEIQPKGLEHLVKTRANGDLHEKLEQHSLSKRELHPAMQPLEDLKDHITILQGLSGKMCRGSHEACFGALGAYASKNFSPPRMETVDGVLARTLGGVFPHLGFVMHHHGAMVTYPSLSALGPDKTLPYYADPMLAYRDLFGTAIGGAVKTQVEIDQNVLDFMVDDVKRYQKRLNAAEKEKLEHYLGGFESMRARQAKLRAMKDELVMVAPKMRDAYTSEVEIERLKAHFEMAGSALIGGLSNVVSIRCDSLNMRLEGLGLGAKTVHELGHMIEGNNGNVGGGGENFPDGKGEFACRAIVLKFHMQLIAELAARLKAVPEGDGTMLDNTVIVYLSDHGDRHHAKFYEWPMIAVGNVNGQFKTGQYLQVPGYDSGDHRTIANLYLSFLHAAGEKRDGFGEKDLQLDPSIKQEGPLVEWMA